MGLPFAPIMTGFPGMAESGAAHDTASPRTHATTPSPSGIPQDAESAGTQTAATSQSDFGSDAESHYPLSDAAILSMQLRAMQGKDGVPDETPNNATPRTNRSAGGPQTARQQTNPSTDGPLDLSSQESELESALESMGMSPGAVQEFMYVGQVLANAAPSLFQDFVAQMVNLADIYKQAKLPGFGGPVEQAQPPKSQSGLEMVSVQQVQASASLTQTSSAETVSVSVQEESLTFVNFEGGLTPAQNNTTAKSGTTASLPPPAPTTSPAPKTGSTAPAA